MILDSQEMERSKNLPEKKGCYCSIPMPWQLISGRHCCLPSFCLEEIVPPESINVLSLFSGIGGAEFALHRLGIPLKFAVSVESSETCRNILQSWWEQSN